MEKKKETSKNKQQLQKNLNQINIHKIIVTTTCGLTSQCHNVFHATTHMFMPSSIHSCSLVAVAVAAAAAYQLILRIAVTPSLLLVGRVLKSKTKNFMMTRV